MNSINKSKNFNFLEINFKNFHYTDNRHGTAFNYIAYMKKGKGKIVSKTRNIEFSEGDVFFIPKGYSYQSFWYGNSDIQFLSFGFDKLFTEEKLEFEAQVICCDDNTKNILASIKTQGGNLTCRDLSLFYGVLSDVLGKLEGSFESRNKLILDKIKNCIMQNPLLSLKEIAEKCNISLPYLYLLFKKNDSITPNEFRQRALCEKAAQLLLVTDKSVEEISSELGFSSSSYFRKILKKHLAKTPREIRNTPKF